MKLLEHCFIGGTVLTLFLFAVSAEKRQGDIAALQSQYEKEQAKIDLEYLKLQRAVLSSPDGVNKWSASVLEWQRKNEKRLKDQAELAASLCLGSA